jgi:hypothetical protein
MQRGILMRMDMWLLIVNNMCYIFTTFVFTLGLIVLRFQKHDIDFSIVLEAMSKKDYIFISKLRFIVNEYKENNK